MEIPTGRENELETRPRSETRLRRKDYHPLQARLYEFKVLKSKLKRPVKNNDDSDDDEE